MPLTELECKKAKAQSKKQSLSDGEGLLLEVLPSGTKLWVTRLWRDGKEFRRTLGTYPDTSLKEARERNRALRREFSPSGRDLFGDVAEEWYRKMIDGVKSPSYARTVRLRLNRYMQGLYKLRFYEVTSARVLQLCRTIEEGGLIETAHRVKNLVGQVCRYGVATGRAENDPTSALRGAFPQSKARNYPTITDEAGIAELLRRIDGHKGIISKAAMKFSILTFARPGEVRHAEWSEINWKQRLWEIPAEKMKIKRPHVVPLAPQALEVLKDLREVTGHQKWIFPSLRWDGRPMSENAVRVALRSMGYSNDELVPHGFRAMASTVLNEHGWNRDWIERQLAHVEKNQVRAAYNRAEYLDDRRRMMEWWGEWLEGLRQK